MKWRNNRMNRKKLASILILLIFSISILALPSKSSAHSTTCKPGSESVGWKVNCSGNGHAGKSNFTYRTALSSNYSGYTQVGVGRWNATSIVNITYAVGSSNLITSHGGPDTSTAAATSSWVNSNGHKSKWEISYNTYVMDKRTSTKNNGTAAHELGHAIGLADLYQSTNTNKLMYGVSDRTVYSPVTADKTGAKEAIK
ncbi:hypothetical protein ACQKM9_03330 [Viridibacillus sp. NPDC093762]|uniref:hypothetical protein n=1 Tax=Viridibacillus sp. NPDC093762 TaxID=3390720 RepID=UPI003D041A0C